jgi:hypothetical protein
MGMCHFPERAALKEQPFFIDYLQVMTKSRVDEGYSKCTVSIIAAENTLMREKAV